MLRDIIFQPDVRLIDVLKRFGVGSSEKIVVFRSEVLSPDSFLWKLLVNGAVYYLYAEDYVPGIEHVKATLSHHIGHNDWRLLEVTHEFLFKEAEPVRNAAAYKRPKIAADMMPYAVDSGYDFVFLARSDENPSKAWFAQ